MALDDIFMSSKSSGIITGNPKIAMRVQLLDALDAILEIIVKVTEKPTELKKRLRINISISATGFPNNNT